VLTSSLKAAMPHTLETVPGAEPFSTPYPAFHLTGRGCGASYWLTVSADDKPRLLLDSLVLGCIGALSAQLFGALLTLSQRLFTWISGYTPPGVQPDGSVLQQTIGPHGLWLVPVATTLGGLLSGLIVYTWAPEAEGHGTDTVVKALHWTGGEIRPRVAPVKMVASAITIGSGGSAGREGPTALIAAGFGSIYADVLKRPPRERRLLVLMGMAAGLSAIFRSPIGTAIFAVEVLYSGIDFESEGLLYCMLSAIVAYAINGAIVGWQPMFRIPQAMAPISLVDYAWYTALGAASGLVATLLPEVFYRTRDAFRALKIPAWLKPGLGGLLVGLMALKLPQLLGGGYGWIQHAIDGDLALHLLIILLVGKMIALSFTISSGGSGGVFAPGLFIGAMLGGTFAAGAKAIGFHSAPTGLVVVGMAAVFGGAARVPIATLLMVAEMTGGYQLLVPAALAVMLSFVIQRNLSQFFRYGSLYEAQVAGRADSPSHHAEQVQIALRLMDHGNIPLPPELSHLHLAALLQSGVALDLQDGSELNVGVLRPESSWSGKRIDARPLSDAVEKARIVAVLRGTSVMLATPDLVLQPGDRLLMIVEQAAMADAEKQMTHGALIDHSRS
jgi:CIC family chloride channel protein